MCKNTPNYDKENCECIVYSSDDEGTFRTVKCDCILRQYIQDLQDNDVHS